MAIETDLNSAIQHVRQGRHTAALKAAKLGMKRYPKHHAFPDIAALALVALRREREAVSYFKKALALDPRSDNTRRNLAQALIATGHSDTAVKLMEQLVAKSPQDRSAWTVLATACKECGLLQDADDAATRAIDLDPGRVDGYTLRSRVREAQGDVSAALQDCETALGHSAEPVGLLLQISRLQALVADMRGSLETAQRAVATAPDNAKARMQLAGQLLAGGNIEDAITELKLVLQIDPVHSPAIEQLAMLQDAGANKELAGTALAAYSAASPKTSDRANLAFALAHIGLKEGDEAASNRFFTEANKTIAARLSYPAKAEERRNQRIISRFPVGPDHRRVSDGSTAPVPIYVVGLPRSGTTLTEAILGAHPDIVPMGERRVADLLQPMIDGEAVFDAAAISRFIEQDAAQLSEQAKTAWGYVDKMPENHRLIGFLATAYPNCKVINLQRDPRDVALSLWRGHFGVGSLSYSYDMKAIAHRFNLYAGIMAHWRRVFPGQILNMSYEKLVSDLPTASRSLADFVGVDWVEPMEEPDLNAGQILTLTAYQLRQPVHQRSVGKWRQHQDLLKPFTKALDPDLWPGISTR